MSVIKAILAVPLVLFELALLLFVSGLLGLCFVFDLVARE